MINEIDIMTFGLFLRYHPFTIPDTDGINYNFFHPRTRERSTKKVVGGGNFSSSALKECKSCSKVQAVKARSQSNESEAAISGLHEVC